jgi:thiol:disulfide interchange protein DsbD
MAAGSTYLLLLGVGAVYPGTIQTGWISSARAHALRADRVAWLRSEPEALRAAAEQRKPVMIDFYADWCIACKELDLYTYSDARVEEALRGFVSVKLDGTDESNAEFQHAYRKYGVRGLPTVLFLTPEGRLLEELTLTGFEDAERFLARLGSARSSG